MNRFALCVFGAALICGVVSLPGAPDHDALWSEFKALHEKEHPAHEEHLRKHIFLQKDALIAAHNARYEAGNETYYLKHTRYSDLTHDEFLTYGLGANFTSSINETYMVSQGSARLPLSFDWRDYGVMTPIKDQGACGSCYAFAGVAVLEAAIKRKYQKEVLLSEQAAIDCTYKAIPPEYNLNKGCEGGSAARVVEYYLNTGITYDYEVPYVSGTNKVHSACRRPAPHSQDVMSSFRMRRMQARSEDDLAHMILEYGPIGVGIACDGEHKSYFQNLGGGIFDNPLLRYAKPNHAVVLLGFGTENGLDYWIMRNSWGTTWGEGGYGKLRRGTNVANIMSDPVYIVESIR